MGRAARHDIDGVRAEGADVIDIRVVRLSPARRFALALAYGAALLVIAWLDAHSGPRAHGAPLPLDTAAVFSAIIAGIQILAGWLATAATVTVTYLAQVVVWLGARVGSILKSTGAMFAKVWDGVKIVWSDVLKPALIWVDKQLTRLHAWLKGTFQPVFDWLKQARDYVLDIYKRFVRPIIDTIDFIRAINRVLMVFHIDVLQSLDKLLADLERRLEEPILWILTRINQVMNVIDRIVTLDGLFQRVTLIKSLARYAPDWMRIAVNARNGPISGGGSDSVKKGFGAVSLAEVVEATSASVTGHSGRYDAFVDEFSAQWLIDLEAE